MNKEQIIKELIRAKKEAITKSLILVDGEYEDIDVYINDLLNALVKVDYEEEIKELWEFEIRHIHDSYCRELKEALINHDAYSFVVAHKGETSKGNYIKAHWDELNKIMDTLYNLCGLNVIEVETNED